MADRDLVVVFADQDLADDEPRDALPLAQAELVETVGEAAEESFEGVGELEVVSASRASTPRSPR